MSYRKTIFNVIALAAVIIIFVAGCIIGINKLGTFNRYFDSKDAFEVLVDSEDVDALIEFIANDDDVIYKNEVIALRAYELIYNSAKNEMKEGSIHTAYDMLGVLPADYENVKELKEKIEFYMPFDKKYTHAYTPYKLNIKINIDPDSNDVYVKCAEQSLLNKVIPYGATKIVNKDKKYSISFDMETCEYQFIVNNHISTRSGKYNH